MNNSRLVRRTPMRRIGKKTREWESAKKLLKTAFERAGITLCELHLDRNCQGGIFLTFAHSLKRRLITTPEELHEVVLACASCHQIIEAWPHRMMKNVVQSTIAARETPVILKAS